MTSQRVLEFSLYFLAIIVAVLSVYFIVTKAEKPTAPGGSQTRPFQQPIGKNPITLHDFSLQNGHYVSVGPLPASNQHSAYAWYKTRGGCQLALIRAIDATGRLLYRVDLDKTGALSLHIYNADGGIASSVFSAPAVFLPYSHNHVGVSIGPQKATLYLNGKPLLTSPASFLYDQHDMEIQLAHGSQCEVHVSHFVSSQEAEPDEAAEALVKLSNPRFALNRASAWVPFQRERPLDVLSKTKVSIEKK